MPCKGDLTGLSETPKGSVLAEVELSVVPLASVISTTHAQFAEIEWNLSSRVEGLVLYSRNAGLTH